MSGMTFDGQREGEEVLFIFRRHISTAKKGLGFFAVMVVLGISPMLLWPNNSQMFFVFFGFVIVGVLGALYSYLLWYFSIYIVTNQRIRQVAQRGLFKKTVVDLGLDKVQSISMNVPGILGGIFNYGTILVQTGVGDLVISMVPNPEDIHNKLQNAQDESEAM